VERVRAAPRKLQLVAYPHRHRIMALRRGHATR
jgi:hypothetical protein